MPRIVVDHFNTVSASGSGTATLRLHRGLRAAGMDSRVWIKRPRRGTVPDITGLTAFDWPLNSSSTWYWSWASGILHWFRKRRNQWSLAAALRGRPPGYEVFTLPIRERATPFDQRIFRGSILHLHWVNGLIDWPSFFASVPNDHPLVWTLHDMNPITGGCHHADDCRNFRTQCENCPQLGDRRSDDWSAVGFAIKQAAYAHKRVHVVTPSEWLARHTRSSALFSNAASIQMIRNGLDLSVYRPTDKLTARQRLGLPADRFLIGFGADSLKNPRKGIQELLDAFSRLPGLEKYGGVTLGRRELPPASAPRPEIFPMGYVEEGTRQALIYSAMDLFALPSWGENLPQMAIEASACKTPVVAFDVGGVPEIVRSGETGWLVPLRDCQQFADRLAWCQEHRSELPQFGDRARQLVEQEYDLRATSLAYQQLYQRALATTASTLPVLRAA